MLEQLKNGAQPEKPSLAQPGSWVAEKAPGNFQASTAPVTQWSSLDEIRQTLDGAATNVPDNSLTGEEEGELRNFTRQRIDTI